MYAKRFGHFLGHHTPTLRR